MPTVFAYCRVSTLDQDPGMQAEAIRVAYPGAVIREEKRSGTTTEGREVLRLLLDMIGEGDRLIVWKLDRLARNVRDLCDIVATLEGKGAALEILDQRIDTATPAGRAFLQMLGVFAEFETNLRKERQLAGIQRMKSTGRTKTGKPTGRPAKAKAQADEIRKAHAEGLGVADIVKRFGVARSSVYRVLGQ